MSGWPFLSIEYLPAMGARFSGGRVQLFVRNGSGIGYCREFMLVAQCIEQAVSDSTVRQPTVKELFR